MTEVVNATELKYDARGLIPCVVQQHDTGEVLMVAWMNEESVGLTLKTGTTWFWSRSRQELWNKGASSGHVQKVVSIDYDCDGDSLLVKVEQKGAACHTGNYSCFSYPLWNSGAGRNLPVPEPDDRSHSTPVCQQFIQQQSGIGGAASLLCRRDIFSAALIDSSLR